MAKPSIEEGDARTTRVSVTLPAFTLFEIDGLIGTYGPTRAQVIALAVEYWLHDNEEKIAHRKGRFAEFQNARPAKTGRRPKA